MTDLESWLHQPPVRSKWRMRAREAIRRVIQIEGDQASPADLLKAVDAVYPFGQRSHEPYKAWLKERRLLIDALIAKERPPPTDEDYAACEVAHDLYEQGDAVAAHKLLEKQAPRRLNVKCPACGSAPGRSCHEKVVKFIESSGPSTYGPSIGEVRHVELVYRVVPHLARVSTAKVSGPLFGARP